MDGRPTFDLRAPGRWGSVRVVRIHHGLARTPGGLEQLPRVGGYLLPPLGLQGSSVDEAAWTMSTTTSASFVPRSFLDAVRYPWADASSDESSRPKLASGACYAKKL
jgi:hypothetical protein